MSPTTEPETNAGGVSRREFLLGTIASAIALGGCGAMKPWMVDAPAPDWLAAACGDYAAAARFGKAYLTEHPKEAQRELLEAAITKAAGPAHSGTETPFQRLDRRVRAEYVRDDTVLVERWILSRTEARVYALAALHSA